MEEAESIETLVSTRCHTSKDHKLVTLWIIAFPDFVHYLVFHIEYVSETGYVSS
jgi:hypothetical protein